MRKYVFLVQSVFLLTTIFLSHQSSAIMKAMSTEELTRKSNIVIEGEIDDVQSEWSKDGTTIITRADVSIHSVIKGHIDQQYIIVEYDGGEVGEIGLKVSDVATLRKKEKVILFLKVGKSKKYGDVFKIVGKGQGKYTVGSDGIARKGGFSVTGDNENIDNNIPVDVLINKIRKIH